MPEVTVDENGQLDSSKDYVGAAGQVLGVLGKVDSAPPQFGEDDLFWSRVLPPDTGHQFAALLRRHNVATMRAGN